MKEVQLHNSNGKLKVYGADDVQEIPAIHEGDAGKALCVNEDEDGVEWKTPESGGSTGSSIMVVHETYSEESGEGRYVLDAMFDDILDAINAGTPVFIAGDGQHGTMYPIIIAAESMYSYTLFSVKPYYSEVNVISWNIGPYRTSGYPWRAVE